MSYLRINSLSITLLLFLLFSFTPVTGYAADSNTEDGSFLDGMMTFEKTISDTHDRIEKNILEQVIRIDEFFGTTTTEPPPKTAYQIRWRNSFKIEDDGNMKYGATLRANFVLPRINERLRLSIYGDEEATESTQSLPEDPGNPGFDRTEISKGRIVNTELRYQYIRTPLTDLFLGAGVRVTLPMVVFVRGRFSQIYRINEALLFRFAETIFVNDFSDLGETTELVFDQQLHPNTLLRLAGSGTFSQDIDGMEWGAAVSLIRELTPKSAIAYTAGVHGNTHIASDVGNYEFFMRYRSNFFRSWLFYEVEPRVFWPRDDHGSYETNFSLTLRLEILFQGTKVNSILDSK